MYIMLCARVNFRDALLMCFIVVDGPVLSPSDDEEDNEFYDCVTDGTAVANTNADKSFILSVRSGSQHRRNSSDSSGEESGSTKQMMFVPSRGTSISKTVTETPSPASMISSTQSKKVRRTRINEKPNYPINLWSIMKNCIGKDLSKIAMPVNFSEPLSMLQRLTEDYEYAEILDNAAMCRDPCEQLAYISAFTISSYSTTACRTGKPFNPLLGETYECDRTDDLGWRSISEQVSHHPPMVAQYCEGRGWKCWQEFTMTSKFRGKYLQVTPMGMAHLEFTATGNRYSWRKVTTTVHNIIVGTLWVDHHGEMEIRGKSRNVAGCVAHLKYIPYSYFTRDKQRRTNGCVMDAEKNVKWVITGTWDHKVEIAPVTATTGTADNPVHETGPSIVAWKRRMPSADSHLYYGFTVLACQLNEPEPGIAPTDSRLRPDQRLMEDGDWNEANAEKIRLEEKQRATRRKREAETEAAAKEGRPYTPYEPVWFERRKEDDSDTIFHVYKNTYWQAKEKQDWSECPDIF